jgi:hypothetical protein
MRRATCPRPALPSGRRSPRATPPTDADGARTPRWSRARSPNPSRTPSVRRRGLRDPRRDLGEPGAPAPGDQGPNGVVRRRTGGGARRLRGRPVRRHAPRELARPPVRESGDAPSGDAVVRGVADRARARGRSRVTDARLVSWGCVGADGCRDERQRRRRQARRGRPACRLHGVERRFARGLDRRGGGGGSARLRSGSSSSSRRCSRRRRPAPWQPGHRARGGARAASDPRRGFPWARSFRSGDRFCSFLGEGAMRWAPCICAGSASQGVAALGFAGFALG